jgi:hypothetical protein
MPPPRRQFRGSFFAAAGLAALLISGAIMAQECPLSAPLVLQDTQSGYAGETGTVWTIAPDCSFTVARRIGLKMLEPYRRGQLTPEQRRQLKELLDRMTAAALPERIGDGPQVNPRRIALAYGGKQAVLSLPPGGGDLRALRAAAQDDPTRLLLELAERLKAMTGG